MIMIRLPTFLCVKRELRGVREAILPVPCFSPFALFSPWEPGYEQIN
jgi:hypothetical protein